jgi:hypothetical protein
MIRITIKPKKELKEELKTESFKKTNPNQGRTEIINASNDSKNLTLKRNIARSNPISPPTLPVQKNAPGKNLLVKRSATNIPARTENAV